MLTKYSCSLLVFALNGVKQSFARRDFTRNMFAFFVLRLLSRMFVIVLYIYI